MSNYTSYFDLYKSLNNKGLHCDPPSMQESKKYTDDEILAELNKILSCIKTLDDYEMLIRILNGLADRLTLRFIFIFYQALVEVEVRLFETVGLHPPIQDFVDQKIDLLLSGYGDFCYAYEKLIMDWACQEGWDKDPVKWEFLVRRNQIYADYTILAGKIIGALS